MQKEHNRLEVQVAKTSHMKQKVKIPGDQNRRREREREGIGAGCGLYITVAGKTGEV